MGALSVLGVAPENPIFPALVNCPLCQQNSLNLFDDISSAGIWLYCQNCLTSGNIITFGARIWNTNLPAAIKKFQQIGMISPREANNAVAEYGRAQIKTEAAASFWAAAESQIWNHNDDIIAVRLRELGVNQETSAGYGLVGVAHSDQIGQLYDAIGRTKSSAARSQFPSIVFPYYDLPGRFSGFLLAQYDDKFALNNVFVPLAARNAKADAGYWYAISGLLSPTQLLRNKFFVVSDPFWALSAQCQQLKDGLNLLPIAASYCGVEASSRGTSWQAFTAAVRVFQAPHSTPDLINQAYNAKGYVYTGPLDTKTKRPMTRKYVIARLAELTNGAETWQKNLINVLTASNELAAFAFATRLTVQLDKLQAFFEKHQSSFSQKFADRVIDSIIVSPVTAKSAQNRWTIIERTNEIVNQAGRQICNIRPRITKIINVDNGEKLYCGQFYVGDEIFNFTEAAEKIERMGLLAFAFSYLAPLGKLVTYEKSWNNQILSLLIQLHPPELENVSLRMAWDSQTNTFKLGNYHISNSGEIVPSATLPDRRPPIVFPEPAIVAPVSIRNFLTPSPQNAFVWNVFSAITANLIAPIVNKDPAGTIFSVTSFKTAAKVGAAINCRLEQTTTTRRLIAVNFLSQLGQRSDWPIFAASVFDDSLFNSALTNCHNMHLCIRANEACAAIGVGYGWQSISGSCPLAETDFSVLKYVLPVYIQRALKTRMRLASQNKILLLSVLHDLHAWLQETNGATFHLPHALNQLMLPDNAHTALMQEIGRAIYNRKLTILPRPRRKYQSPNYIMRQKKHWWLNCTAIDNYFAKQKTLLPNWSAVINLMNAAGVYAGEEEVGRLRGILVKTEWCDQFYTNESDNNWAGFKAV